LAHNVARFVVKPVRAYFSGSAGSHCYHKASSKYLMDTELLR